MTDPLLSEMTPYFAGVNELELVARVARRWVFLCKRNQPALQTIPILCGYSLSALPPKLSSFFPTAILSISEYCGAKHWSSDRWLHEVCKRSQLRLTFRAVFFFDYKANRR